VKGHALLSAVFFVLSTQFVSGQTKPDPDPSIAVSKAADNRWLATSATRSIRDVAIYREASPSVVLILADDSLGSGALIDASGLILTNEHVVGGATEVAVVFKPAIESATPGESDIRRGEVVKVDALADLALIRVPTVPAGHDPLPLGGMETIVIGADVYAIGHPNGAAWTYTKGIISRLSPVHEWGYSEDPFTRKADVIQTQTPISSGSSGGPLLNDAGALVGVNSFGDGDGQNMNFAISLGEINAFIVRAGNRSGIARPSFVANDAVQAGSFFVANRSSQSIFYLYASPVDADGWGSDRLGDGVLFAGDRFQVFPSVGGRCQYDLKVVYVDETEEVAWNQDICATGEMYFTGSDAQ